MLHSKKSSLYLYCFLLLAGSLFFIFACSRTTPIDTCYNETNNIKEKILQGLHSLTPQERKDIETLFRRLFLHEGFAYPLFDEKAVAYTAFFTRIPFNNIHCGLSYPPESSWWLTWEKYQDLFPMQQFALIATKDCKYNRTCIYLINKKLYFKVLADARLDTRWVVNSGKTLEELSKIFNDFAFDSLQNYHEVLGVLLGFGENNAYLFYRRDLLEQILSEKHPEYGKAVIMGNLGKFRKELEQIDTILMPVHVPNTYTRIQMLYPVGFLVDNTTVETQKIKLKLKCARDRISTIYSQGDFFEVTLEKLMSVE